MTAETLKPFISSPSMSNYVGSPKRSFLLIGLSVLIFVLIAGIFGFTMWNTVRIVQLQTDVDNLNKLAASMQKRLGLDYLDDLQELENAYSSDLSDDDDIDDDDDDDADLTSNEDGDLLDAFDEDDEDDEDDDDYNDFNFDGSGKDPLNDSNYDDSNDDDDSDAVDDSLLDDYAKFHRENQKRKTRSISEVNGLPVYHESYAMRRNKTGGPEDEKIEKFLLNKSPSPTLRYDWDDKKPRRDIHENKPRRRYMAARAGPETIIQLPPHLFNSRQHGVQPTAGHSTLKNLGNRIAQDENHLRMQRRIQPTTLAVHFNLNRIYTKGLARNQFGSEFYTLTPNSWSENSWTIDAFPVENGVVIIKEPGIYFVYAQIFYHNNQQRNGFFIFHNSRAFLECTLTVTDINTENSNTCHTSGAIYLAKDDRIHLKDVLKGHSAIFGNAKSFLGLIRLGSSLI